MLESVEGLKIINTIKKDEKYGRIILVFEKDFEGWPRIAETNLLNKKMNLEELIGKTVTDIGMRIGEIDQVEDISPKKYLELKKDN